MTTAGKKNFEWERCNWLFRIKDDAIELRRQGRDPYSYHCQDSAYKVGVYDLCDKLYCINERREVLPDGEEAVPPPLNRGGSGDGADSMGQTAVTEGDR